MPTGYSRSPKLIKGALVELSDRFIGPIPNVIVFQYNPESITRTLEVWSPDGEGSGKGPSAGKTVSITAQPFDPPESFTLVLEMDDIDKMEGSSSGKDAGVANRLAALELLLYPQADTLLGSLMGAVFDAAGALSKNPAIAAKGDSIAGFDRSVPRGTVPVVMFVMGPGRVVPVRLTSMTIEETAYSPLLYPIRAKVNLGLKILTPKDFPACRLTKSEEMAIMAFKLTRKQKEGLAANNVQNTIDSISGIM